MFFTVKFAKIIYSQLSKEKQKQLQYKLSRKYYKCMSNPGYLAGCTLDNVGMILSFKTLNINLTGAILLLVPFWLCLKSQ